MKSKHILLVIFVCHSLVKNGHQLVAIGNELAGVIENAFIDNCEVVDGAKLSHLLFIKTNDRMGGFVKNIQVSNVKSGKIDVGILVIETDVLYQWRNLVSTVERRLTSIQEVYLDNVMASNVKFISRILGQKQLPIKDVFLKNVKANVVSEKEHIDESVLNFNFK